jgi:hypothetical protein
VTTSFDLSEIHEAGRLFMFAVTKRLTPSRDEEYRRLVGRYCTSAEFRTLVNRVAMSQSCEVLHVDETSGVVLSPAPDSPYAFRLDDYPPRLVAPVRDLSQVQMRLLNGFAHLAIATVCYPTESDLIETSIRMVSPATVDEAVRVACARFRSGESDASDAGAEFEQAWRLWDRLPSIGRTRENRGTTRGILRGVLELLYDWGLMQKGDREEYRARDRYRIKVREEMAGAAFTALREAVAVASQQTSG